MIYSLLIGGLLLFPWSIAAYIAFGAVRAARRGMICSKQTETERNLIV